MEKLEKHGELRDGSDFEEHFLGQQARSETVNAEKASLEQKIESRKIKLQELLKKQMK